MSCFCQFCDKEMMAENLATIEHGFITCGNLNCISKAKHNVAEFAREAIASEEHTRRMVVFSSKTPEVDNTWRIVEPKDHPAALGNVEVMSQMKLGHFLFDEEEKIYYCTKTGLEVMNQVREKLVEGENGES